MTKTIWNANLNGLCGILAMLYGEGDFQRTLDLSCAMGFDCDNQAATISGLLGVMYGAKSLPESLTKPIEGWEKPFNDRYINITRFDMPDASIEDMIERTYNKAIELVCAKGGKVKGDMVYVNPKAQFIPRWNSVSVRIRTWKSDILPITHLPAKQMLISNGNW